MGCLFCKVDIRNIKYINNENLENNLLAWKNKEKLQQNLSTKKLNIIIESELSNYYYYTNHFLKSKNATHILSYKISSKDIDSILHNSNKITKEINYQLNSMDFKSIDIIYWIKQELNESKIQEIINEIKQNNEIIHIGVVNHDLNGIKKVNKILKENQSKLFAVKNNYNMIRLSSERLEKLFEVKNNDNMNRSSSEILEYCKNNNIYFFSCDVFEKGILSGKYNSDNPMPEKPNEDWNRFYNEQIEKIDNINEAFQKNKDKVDISVIPIKYNIYRGTIPVIEFNEIEKYLDNKVNFEALNSPLNNGELIGFERTVDMQKIKLYE